MEPAGGWQRLSAPSRSRGAQAFAVTPFTRLARAHALSVAGDAMVTVALAGSLFFSIDPTDARWRVLLYLALTMAPFAVVAPFIGPLLDRASGGRRWMVVAANAIRVVVCLAMISGIDNLLLFPEAFAVLVMGKTYSVARASLVPTVVATDAELVEANSKLQLISGIVAFVAGVPAGIISIVAGLFSDSDVVGSQAVLIVAAVVFACAAVVSLAIPATTVAAVAATDAERVELRGIGIVLAASAMGLIRAIVGFLTFLLAFDLRTGGAPTWHYGVVLAGSGIGALIGSSVAPLLRRSMSEERMLSLVLGVTVGAGVLASWMGGLNGAAVLSATVGGISTAGKLAFDSLVQRDAPDADRGRSFARFETRFQMLWVGGALVPVVLDLPARIGFLVIAGTAAFALFTYLGGQNAADRARVSRPPAGPGVPHAPGQAGAPRTALVDVLERPPAVVPEVVAPPPPPPPPDGASQPPTRPGGSAPPLYDQAKDPEPDDVGPAPVDQSPQSADPDTDRGRTATLPGQDPTVLEPQPPDDPSRYF